MASISKRTKSKFWTACYTDRLGRQLKRSTKTTDRSQAMQMALELERVEDAARAGTLTTVQLQKILNDVSEKTTGDSLNVPTVEAYLQDWEEGIKVRNSEATLERYHTTARQFLTSLGLRAKQPITSVTAKHVEEFLNQRLARGVAPKTAIVDMKILNTAFRRAEAYGIILKNPVAAVRLPKAESSERGVFTQDEVQKLLAAAPNADWQTLIMLGYFVGARLGDCVHMKWDSIHAEDGVIVYVQRKTGKKVVVPMHFHVIEHIKHLSEFGTEGHLCPTLAAKTPGGKHGLSESFKRIIIRAGIDPMVVEGKGYRKFSTRTFHSLRHSFSSVLANAGVTEEIRMKLTGHSSKAIHSRYTHMEVETLKSAMTSMPLFSPRSKSPA